MTDMFSKQLAYLFSTSVFLAGICLEPFTIVQSRGAYAVKDEKGYVYSYRGINKDETRSWRCNKRHKFKCNAYVKTQAEENFIIQHFNEHNHAASDF